MFIKKFNVNIILLSIGFSVSLFGFNGVCQYITAFFSEMGFPNTGFWVLILLYTFFLLSSPFAGILISKYGAKLCMLVSILSYSLFALSLLSKSQILVCLAACLVGGASAPLWVGQGCYLVKASKKESYGVNSGFFVTSIMLGNTLGIFFLGFLISRFSYFKAFGFYSILPLAGFIPLLMLKDFRETEKRGNQWLLVGNIMKNRLVLKLSIFGFYSTFIRALFVGIIPLKIISIFGSEDYIGILCSMYYMGPILLSYAFGRFSDKTGRRFMISLSYAICIASLLIIYFFNIKWLLIAGIVFSAISFSICRPLMIALTGDISSKNNVDSLMAFFILTQNAGWIIGFFLPIFVKGNEIYLIAAFVSLISWIILSSALKENTEDIKLKLDKELSCGVTS